MKRRLALWAALALFLALAAGAPGAAAGARRGLRVCSESLVPSLFPFFVLSNLLSSLGLSDLLSGLTGGICRRLLHISDAGAQAFFLGVTGGYPVGAAAVARLRTDGRVSRAEAEHLLAFCNNAGPAFILGTASGIFHSLMAGLLLWAAQITAAVCVGILLRPRTASAGSAPAPAAPVPPAKALSTALTASLSSTLSVCGCVVFFSALLGLIPGLAALAPLPRALLTGALELGSGFAALTGLTPEPLPLAAAALLLGWGGLSVHGQTLAAVADTDIGCARHLAGRALCGCLAAVFTYVSAQILL